MELVFVKKTDLVNNLQLIIYDGSKKLAGDRWRVSVIAQIKISVDDALKSSSDPDINKDEISNLLGSHVIFEQKRERYFIDENKKESVFNELCDNFINSTLKYLSHPDFPKRFVLKTYKEMEKKKLLADRISTLHRHDI